MNKETFIKMTGPFRRNANRARALHIINEILSDIILLAYPALIIFLFLTATPKWYVDVIVPFVGFVVVTVFRKIFNRKRPYEKFEIAPVIPKDKKGQSFPSRHVFSAFIIACTFFGCSPFKVVGIIFFIFAFIISIIRVISGVHFISDVLAGAVFAIAFAYAGFCFF